MVPPVFGEPSPHPNLHQTPLKEPLFLLKLLSLALSLRLRQALSPVIPFGWPLSLGELETRRGGETALCPHQIGLDQFLRAAPCPQGGHAGEEGLSRGGPPTPGALETISREVLGGS